jgi:hypothetical protein
MKACHTEVLVRGNYDIENSPLSQTAVTESLKGDITKPGAGVLKPLFL